jgi:ABC-type Fe3+/spermidine/putrescine transport system ATPase subunit
MSLSDRIAVMNAGQVEQVGPPEEIYARPASLFVAGFVGQVNALPARATRHANGHVVVEILGRTYSFAAERPLPQDVLVLVRPEAIRLGEAGAAPFTGIVEDVEYRGDRIEYRIRMGDMLLLALDAALGQRRRVAAGDRVGLELVESAMHVLPAQKQP